MQTFLYLDEHVACAFSSNVGSIDSHYRIRAEGRVQERQDFSVWVEVKCSSLKLFLKGERRKPTAGSRVAALCWPSPTRKSLCHLMNTQSDPFMGKRHLKIRGLGVQLSQYCRVCRKS